MRLTILPKFLILSGIPTSFLLILGMIAYANLSSQERLMDNVVNEKFKNFQAISTISEQIFNVHKEVSKIVRWKILEYQNIQETHGTLQTQIDQINQIETSHFITTLQDEAITQIKASLQEYKAFLNFIKKILPTDEFLAQIYLGSADVTVDILTVNFNLLKDKYEEASNLAFINSQNRFKTTILMFLIIFTLSVVISLLVSFLVGNKIVANIKKMVTTINYISESKDFTKKIELDSGDEIGLFAKHINNMSDAIKQYTLELKDYSDNLKQKVAERTAELFKAKEAAETANKAKSTFLANMSHELRSPLNAILGFAQLMTRSQSLPQEHQENIGIINRSGEHLLTLINNVLDLSKIEAGRTTLNEQNFDLYRLLDDLEDMFQLRADDKHLQLLFERTTDIPQYVRTDEVKLRQILINLLNNALKFTKQGGISLRVGKDSEASKLIFEIEDTGDGIAPDELDSLFEAFVQTKTGQQAQEGTGLGLPISRQFVQLMGGEMTVSSQVGKGTIFKFAIKVSIIVASDVKTKQPTRRVIALAPNQPRYRILIVDDKWNNRQLLLRLLNPFGFELKEAGNGQEALNIWETWQPHLIWMDMRMPVMDGYETTQKIKATTQGQATAIIALTASVLEEERAVVLSAGCDDFMRKPFREEDIFDAMNKHLGVRYIYEDNQTSTTSTEAERSELTPASLATLSPDLLANLRQAILELDLQSLLNFIKQIPNPTLANALTELANRFQYDQLLGLIEQAEAAEAPV